MPEPRQCPDCGVSPGELHAPNCDVERCPECGGQRLFDDCEETRPRLPWTGEWPGYAECRAFSWYSRWVGGQGWVECDGSEPGAGPDLNRLAATGVWDADAGRYRKPQGEQSNV